MTVADDGGPHDDPGRPLTDHEARLVFRRASEIDVVLQRREDGWHMADLEAVAADAGISADAVRRAAADVRLSASTGDLRGPVVGRSRIVEVDAAVVMAELTAWLRDQLFEPVRDRPSFAVFDRRTDDDAVRRRARDGSGRYRLGAVRRIDVTVAGLPGAGSAVRLAAALAETRGRRTLTFGARVTPLVWGAAAVAAGVSSSIALADVALASPVIVAGCGHVAWRRASQLEREERAAVGLALDGALDRLGHAPK